MPFNINENYTKNYFLDSNLMLNPSKVIELLSIFHAFSDDQHKLGKELYFSYLKDYLTNEDKEIINDLHRLPFYGLQVMLLALKTNEFNNIESFIENVRKMSCDDFTYILSGELITHHELVSFKKDHNLLTTFMQNNKWIISRKNCSIEKLIQDPEDFKTRFVRILNKLNNKNFENQIEEFEDKYIRARRYIDVFLINNQPTDIIREFKEFDRTEIFKDIIMVPSLMLAPHRTYYFHNTDSLLILYDIALIKDYTDLQIEKSSEFLKTISDVSKLNILSLLKYNTMCSSELADTLDLTTATISRHIDSLMKFDLIEVSKEKNTKYYKLNCNMAFKHFDDIIKLL